MLTLQEAAFLSRKSTQTIRRLIKSNKIKYRRRRTPQGFNYYIEKDSLLSHFDLTPRVLPEEPVSDTPVSTEQVEPKPVTHSVFNAKIQPSTHTATPNTDDVYEVDTQKTLANIPASQDAYYVLDKAKTQEIISLQTKQLGNFAGSIKQLVDQHQEDKRNLYSIIHNSQKRVSELESQIKQLQQPQKKWYEFWK